MGRLARFKRMNPQLALNMVADKNFMMTMASENNEEKMEEEIENKLVEVATQLQSDRDSLLQQAEADRSSIEDLEDRVFTLEKSLEETQTEYKNEIESLRIDLQREEEQKEKAEIEGVSGVSKPTRITALQVLKQCLRFQSRIDLQFRFHLLPYFSKRILPDPPGMLYLDFAGQFAQFTILAACLLIHIRLRC